MHKVVVLGAGLVGSVIARDLALDSELEVSIADINDSALKELSEEFEINSIYRDLSERFIIQELVENFDLVVGALPGYLGYQALQSVIEVGKSVVDISFFEEDPFTLDKLAKKKEVTAIIDCGVAPGLSNIILGHVHSLLDHTHSFECYVGGLPVERQWPYEYKAPFSPVDVIEEYIRDARFVENRKIITKPALSDSELIEFPEIGELEAFNTDGLRTLLKTMDIPNMKEKTLRYPGHIKLIKILKDTGFFSKRFIDVNGISMKPLDLATKLLSEKWQLGEKEEDYTIMKIIIDGTKENKLFKYSYELLDHYDKENNIISMARTTGYTASIMARLVVKGKFEKKGICPPEYIGKNEVVYNYLMNELRKRNVNVKEKIEEVNK
ncbi:Lysine 6-dehydrogenase [subsurface metagenome]